MTSVEDAALAAVENVLRTADPEGKRIARALRRTFDQIYDGRNTGRYSWSQLRKTEKTHFGSLVEINLQREFSSEFHDGIDLDYRIGGIEVDCKWSAMDSPKNGVWMLPPEVIGHLCLLLTGSDELSVWSCGLVRPVESLLTTSEGNRDEKRWLNATGRSAIRWLWRNASLPENILLHIPPADLSAIMLDLRGERRGQKRLNELFRRVPNRVIRRAVIATVAQQHDYMKRVRENGGSRDKLRPEGIVIFGDYLTHRTLAQKLGLPAINDGDSMSARLIKVDGPVPGAAKIEESWYRLCNEGEGPTKPAPKLPDSKQSQRT